MLTPPVPKNQPLSIFVNQKVPKSSSAFECNCGKKYKDKSGLWRHKKKCIIENNEENGVNGLNKSHVNLDNDEHLEQFATTLGHR